MASVATPDPTLFAPNLDLPPEAVIFGSSPAMGAIRDKLIRAANANIPVLIQGQNGTGKEILAKLIHQRSPWGKGPFVKVNCPAIPGTLLESELFGYEKGAFTGAYGSKPGRVELAHRGTLFLDEIAELEPSLQAKLLQLLQDGQFCRIGAQEDKHVEVRVVCATNRRLQAAIESGTFREDLLYRINAVTVELPPLRERSGDIPMLVNYFLETHGRLYKSAVRPISKGLLDQMQRYHWPGNIRELENLIKGYVIFGTEEEIRKAMHNGNGHYLDPDAPHNGVISLKKVIRKAAKQLEREIILKALDANHWNRRLTARALDISYAALLYKMREAGVPPTRGPRAQNEIRVESLDRIQ